MKTIKDIDVENKKVFLRLDLNVPIENGKIVDNNRIVASLKTINYLIDKNAKIIIVSHLGKVKEEKDFDKYSLKPVRDELEKLLNKKIDFQEELVGRNLKKKIKLMNPGEILMLENIRFLDVPDNLESGCNKKLSKYYSKLVDVFILDAFASSHRMHTSTYGLSQFIPHAIGFLVEKEIDNLEKIKKEEKVLILGGAKVSDKVKMIKNLLPTSKKVLIGGAMCATFLKATNQNVGNSFVDEEFIEEAKELLKTNKIILPIDAVTEKGIMDLENITDESILDIGPRTIKLFCMNINEEIPVLMNGTMGKYEEIKYENGTKEIFNYLSKKNIKTIVCGGDCASASKKYNFKPYYLSTGGGASLEYLEDKPMPVLEIMK